MIIVGRTERLFVDQWDPSRRLTWVELQRWMDNYHRRELTISRSMLTNLRQHEVHGHVEVRLDGLRPSPFIAIAREIHRQGYRNYFPNPEQICRDAAGREILSADTDSTQDPETSGYAWMCYTKHPCVMNEEDLYGLMYEIEPRKIHLYKCPISSEYGWRTLPVSKLYVPTDAPSPLSEWGLQRLDRLELLGTQIVELSGLSVRPVVPQSQAGLAFHEIMRRMVHHAIIRATDAGLKKVFAFAIVERTRDNISRRIGRDNFVLLGESFRPPGEGVDENTLLAPSIIEPYRFMDRLVSSYRTAQATGRPLKVLTEGIRFYTRGLAWRYLSRYPEMIELLQELDVTAPDSITRNAQNDWHDRCGDNADCPVCSTPRYRVIRLADITHAERLDPRTLVA